MGLFICSKCECVENTALGWWWSKDHIRLVLPDAMKRYEKGHGLCSECLPSEAKFEDGGSPHTVDGGKWHGKFPKQHIDDFMKENKQHYKRDGFMLIYRNKA